MILLEIKSVTDDGAYGIVSSNAYVGGLGRAKLESVMPQSRRHVENSRGQCRAGQVPAACRWQTSGECWIVDLKD